MKFLLTEMDAEFVDLFNKIDAIIALAADSIRELIKVQAKKIPHFPIFLAGTSDQSNPEWRKITVHLSKSFGLETGSVVCPKAGMVLKEEGLFREHTYIVLLPQGMFIFPAVKAHFKSGEIDIVPDWDNKIPCSDLEVIRFGKIAIQKIIEEIREGKTKTARL